MQEKIETISLQNEESDPVKRNVTSTTVVMMATDTENEVHEQVNETSFIENISRNDSITEITMLKKTDTVEKHAVPITKQYSQKPSTSPMPVSRRKEAFKCYLVIVINSTIMFYLIDNNY